MMQLDKPLERLDPMRGGGGDLTSSSSYQPSRRAVAAGASSSVSHHGNTSELAVVRKASSSGAASSSSTPPGSPHSVSSMEAEAAASVRFFPSQLPVRKLMIKKNPTKEDQLEQRWCCCSWRVCLDFKCCRRFRAAAMEPIVIAIPIKSIDDALSGPFAFDLIKREILDFIIQRAWDTLLFSQHITIVFQTLEEDDMARKRELEVAVLNSFRYHGKMTHYETVRAGSEGWWSALLAAGIYVVCLASYIPLTTYYRQSEELWAYIMSDFIIIVLWVVIWHPVEILLFSRLMLRRKRQVCKKLENANVKLEVLRADEDSLYAINSGVSWGIDVFEDDEEEADQEAVDRAGDCGSECSEFADVEQGRRRRQ